MSGHARYAIFELCLALAACATVPPGHAAVALTLSGVKHAPLGEGVTYVGPFAQVDLFDLRAMERDEDLVGLAADGAPVFANASVVTWHIIPNEVIAFDQHVGPNAYERLIRPVVQAAVRSVIARYPAFALMDTRNIPDINRAVTKRGVSQLRPMHIQLDSVLMRKITVDSRPLDTAIIATGMLQQEVLNLPHVLQLARAHAQELLENGKAVAAANAAIAPTLTPRTLADSQQRAWQQLITSSRASVTVNNARTIAVEVGP